jgi:molybdopterin-binding protein
MMTVRAAASRLGVGYSTVKQWIRSGRIRTTRTPGGHHRVSETEIARLLSPRDTGRRRPRAAITGGIEGLSARNQLAGVIEEVRIDGLLAQVRLRIGDQRLTSVITADAVRALRLRRGDEALAVIKSTEIMIARPQPDPGRGR